MPKRTNEMKNLPVNALLIYVDRSNDEVNELCHRIEDMVHLFESVHQEAETLATDLGKMLGLSDDE